MFVDTEPVNGDDGRAVALSIEREDATIADLAAALSLPESALVVDGVVYFSDALLHIVPLVEGSRISPLGPNQSTRSGIGRSWVGVAGGPHAGMVKRMDADGAITIGRGPLNDLEIDNTSVSLQHAVIEKSASGVRLRDLGSTNGTWVNGRPITKKTPLAVGQTVRIGSSMVELVDIDTSDKPLATNAAHADVDGRILFNRPPRGPVATDPALVQLPEALPDRPNPTLRIVSLLVPILLAIVMVAALGSFRFALFALLSPLMLLGNWFAGRREVKKERTGDVISRRAGLATLRRDLQLAEEAERQRRSERAPNLLEIRRRIELPSNRLWERRLDAPDAMTIRVGCGSTPWQPYATREGDEDVDEEIAEALSGSATLTNVEILTDLRDGPVGLTGDQAAARSAARSALLQLAAHHGPADITVAVVTTLDQRADWEWAQWLPHTTTSNGGVRIFTGEQSNDFASDLLGSLTGVGTGPAASATTTRALVPGIVLVIDDLDTMHQKSSAVRQLLEHTTSNVYAIVLAPVEDQLPASVATVVHIDGEDGEFTARQPRRPDVVETGIIDGATTTVAADIARSLARFDDPEVLTADGALPARVGPRDLLPEKVLGPSAAEAISRRWLQNKRVPHLTVPIGMSGSGPFRFDLVQDGPHGLVAGTTGSGKSELLRTIVLGLAVNYDPDDLVFVLVDYKGGSAFDACSGLPHVVGLVTDLDEHLAERALQSLEAELHHREGVLRRSGCSDIIDYRNAGSRNGALPRLVVVIDEFATMRAELPDFVKSLIGIAQRGRSLGVHLILATQRPSGAVDANIRANTNLRIALRVQDTADSTDVIDDPGAARIDRCFPGRALVWRGEGDLSLVQTAYMSGPVDSAGPPLRIGQVSFGAVPPRIVSNADEGQVTNLERLVEAIRAAASGYEPPRRPWLEQLPDHLVDPDVLRHVDAGDAAHVVLALGDDPMQQRRVTRGWDLDDGHLAVIGGPGSGVTTALRSAITALGAAQNDRPLWVFPVDHGAGGLTGIDGFDHVSEVIGGSDDTRQARLLQFLSTTLDERRARHVGLGDHPLIVVAIDGCGAFSDLNDVESGMANGDLVNRLGRDGPSVGIYFLIGAGSVDEIPRHLRRSIHQFIVLEQTSESAYSNVGISTRNLPSFVPGRALVGSPPMVVQVIDWEAAVELGAVKLSALEAPPSMDGLSSDVSRQLLPVAKVEPNLAIPIGLSDNTRDPAQLVLRAGEHALIAGPSRSGRTNALRVIASQLRAADRSLVLVGVTATIGSPLLSEGVFDAGGPPEDLESVLRASLEERRRWVVLVDDAEVMELDNGALYDIARKSPANVTIIAAVRSSSVRQNYGHWTRFVRASSTGLLLQPDPTVDGELLGVRLPRGQRFDAFVGRGYLVQAGEVDVVQVAH